MADTIADIVLTGDAYQDLYDATGITVGVSITIQNKSNSNVHIQLKATSPSATSTDGYLLVDDPKSLLIVGADESGCWAIGTGPISVQQA